MRVTQRKAPTLFPSIKAALEAYRAAFRIPSTTDTVIAVAADLAQERKLQFWDSVICVVAAQAGATVLFSEDMQDGADIRGLKIVNPFDAKNDALIEKILGA
jgi:predicted nucleic acid-binding protein